MRLELMDAQDMEGCFLFPTLGVGMEEALLDDPVAAHGVFEAFNRWLEDDWGYAFEDRLFAAPYFTLLDPDAAVRELDRVLEHGAHHLHAGRADHAPERRPLTRRSRLRPVLGAGERGRRRGRVSLRRGGLRPLSHGLGRVIGVRSVPSHGAVRDC